MNLRHFTRSCALSKVYARWHLRVNSILGRKHSSKHAHGIELDEPCSQKHPPQRCLVNRKNAQPNVKETLPGMINVKLGLQGNCARRGPRLASGR